MICCDGRCGATRFVMGRVEKNMSKGLFADVCNFEASLLQVKMKFNYELANPANSVSPPDSYISSGD